MEDSKLMKKRQIINDVWYLIPRLDVHSELLQTHKGFKSKLFDHLSIWTYIFFPVTLFWLIPGIFVFYQTHLGPWYNKWTCLHLSSTSKLKGHARKLGKKHISIIDIVGRGWMESATMMVTDLFLLIFLDTGDKV